MASTWKTMTYFALSLPNEPGELVNFMQRLGEAGINLVGLWGYAPGGGDPRLSCVPESPDAFREFAGDSGIIVEVGRTWFWTGDDEPGALVDTLRRIAEAGVNIDAIEGVTAGDRFGCFLWAAEGNWEALESALAE